MSLLIYHQQRQWTVVVSARTTASIVEDAVPKLQLAAAISTLIYQGCHAIGMAPLFRRDAVLRKDQGSTFTTGEC